jgi:hypothetical protein
VVNAGQGADTITISEQNGAFTNTEATSFSGGSGNDRIVGGAGGEAFTGGRGRDIQEGRGGSDSFAWATGHGNDKVNGQGGADVLQVAGTSGVDAFTLEAAGARLHVERVPETLDVGTVSNVELTPLGGNDTTMVHDLTGTGLAAISVDLGVGVAGDSAADTVTVEGTPNSESITATSVSGQVQMSGSPAAVTLSSTETANDRLVVQGLQSDDTLSGGSASQR